MIYVIGSEKGGQGKSTIAALLAIRLQSNNRKTFLIDKSVQRGSSSAWLRRRKINGYQPIVEYIQSKEFDLTGSEMEKIYNEYDDIVIDVPGIDSDALRTGMLVADVIIVPIVPAMMDLDTVEHINSLCAEARELSPNKDLKAHFLMNKCSPNRFKVLKTLEAREMIADFEDCEIIDNWMCLRDIFENAAFKGLTLEEYIAENRKTKSNQNGLEEFNAVLKEILSK